MTKKALVLAAGTGKRMLPLSTTIPKPLLPLLNKPILEIIITHLRKAGFEDVAVVISPFFPVESIKNLECSVFIQKTPNGMGAAILEARKWLDSRSFLVCSADSLFSIPFLRTFVQLHHNKSPDVTIATEFATLSKMRSRSCVVLNQEGFVVQIIEKPTTDEATGNLASAPVYMFNQNILSELERTLPSSRDEIEVQTAIQAIIDNNGTVQRVQTKRLVHLSNPEDFFEVNMLLLKEKSPQLILSHAHPVKIIPPVLIDHSATIAHDAILGPNVIFGPNVIIKGKIRVKNTIILRDAILKSNFSDGVVWPGDSLSISTKSSSK